MQTAQFWKPGERKPRDGGSGPGNSTDRQEPGDRGEERTKGSRRDRAGKEGNNEKESSTGNVKKKGTKSKGKDGGRAAAADGIQEVSRSASKAPVSGPSQGLLAMKFMQRKARTEATQAEQRAKRHKLEEDFSSAYAKRLKMNNAGDRDRLVCLPDEQDPALVLVGRRSFGGFNQVAEAAYDACVRDIEAGERLLWQPAGGGGDEGDGISDTEMAETLGKNVRFGGRR